MPTDAQHPPQPLSRLLLSMLGWGLAAAAPAAAQSTGPYVGVSQAVARDTNIFRTPEGQPRTADTYLSSGALAGGELRLGRQRLFADGQINNNRFQNVLRLDNVNYSLNAGLDWATVERLSGTVRHSVNENLASYGSDNTPLITTKNIERRQQTDASVRVGGVTALSLEASVQHRSTAYSVTEFAFREFNQDQARFGMRYRSSAQLEVGVAVRATRGEYPLFRRTAGGSYLADRYRRRDIDLTASWVPTGRSTVTARVSFGRQTNTEAREYEFSGLTGSLAWAFRPTGKLGITTTLTRDTGTENTFFGITGGESALSDTSRISNGLRVNATYDATAKIRLNAAVAYTRRDLADRFSLSSTGQSTGRSGRDATTRISLGARYAPMRSLAFECSIATEQRDTTTALSYDYSADTASCSAQVVLQ